MQVLYNFLLHLYQFYSIIFGYTYIFIDFEKRIMKFYLFLKIYVHFVNVLYALILIHYIADFIIYEGNTYANADDMTEGIFMIFNLTRLCILIGLIILRIKEEMIYKKWHNLYQIYFDKLIPKITLDKSIEILLSLNILIMFVVGILKSYELIDYIIEYDIFEVDNIICTLTFTAIEHHIMFHHNFLLSYFTNGFIKLNNQLRNEQDLKTFLQSYVKISMLLEQFNILNGPFILVVLFSQLIGISINICAMIHFLLMLNLLMTKQVMQTFTLFIITVNIILYFVLCDRLYRTIKETDEILMEYCARQLNPEVLLLNMP